jgi:hypothetical protein
MVAVFICTFAVDYRQPLRLAGAIRPGDFSLFRQLDRAIQLRPRLEQTPQ